MADGRYMLDTDILIFMLRGLKSPNATPRHRQTAQRLLHRIEHKQRNGASVCISMVSACELEFGAAKANDPEKERRALCKILAPFDLMETDTVNMPRHYGDIRWQLEQNGHPIGAMDLMIAAHARAIDATLVTNNTSEFKRIHGLKIENWAA